MNLFQAILYGIVQGVTEFLPVSSTAHLTLLPWLLGWNDPGVTFDVAVHLGTAVAVILYFIKDWIRLIKAGFTEPKSTDGKLFWLIVLATVPGGIFGVLLDQYAETLRSPLLIGVMLIIIGIFLYAADKKGSSKTGLSELRAGQSLVIGVSQIFAIIPGVSRSGITMAAGRTIFNVRANYPGGRPFPCDANRRRACRRSVFCRGGRLRGRCGSAGYPVPAGISEEARFRDIRHLQVYFGSAGNCNLPAQDVAW
jgi:undecaprenyl pyrophosphate phosphatase UppP